MRGGPWSLYLCGDVLFPIVPRDPSRDTSDLLSPFFEVLLHGNIDLMPCGRVRQFGVDPADERDPLLPEGIGIHPPYLILELYQILIWDRRAQRQWDGRSRRGC